MAGRWRVPFTDFSTRGGVMSNRMDDKLATLLALTGETEGNISDLTVLWLKQELGL